VVTNIEIAFTHVLAKEGIGDEFQDGGLFDPSFPDKKDGVSIFLLVFDDPLFERLYVARRYD